MKILNKTKNTVVASQGQVADTFVSRMTGLLGRKGLGRDEALVITRCQSIHMFFMRFAIDALFVNSEDTVVGTVESIKPYRLSRIFWKASYCVELSAGAIQRSQTSVGDSLKIDKSV